MARDTLDQDHAMRDSRIPGRRRPLAALAATILAMSGCGGGGEGELLQDVSIVVANYLVLDLQTGAIEARSDIPDLATGSSYRQGKMVFKAVAAGASGTGQAAGTYCAQGDEAPAGSDVRKFYIGVFEVTQAQWQLIAGTSPWTTVLPTSVVGGVTANPEAPAFNITRNAAAQALTAKSGQLGLTLTLPTDREWEHACRAGGASYFSWGASRAASVAGAFALVAETGAGRVGPLPAGSLAANAFGIYDMHGNVWEMTSDGSIRGGSWSDTLAQARAANKATLDSRTAHGLVGLRLVLAP